MSRGEFLTLETSHQEALANDGQKSTSPIGLTGIPMASLSSHETELFLLSPLSLCPLKSDVFLEAFQEKSLFALTTSKLPPNVSLLRLRKAYTFPRSKCIVKRKSRTVSNSVREQIKTGEKIKRKIT